MTTKHTTTRALMLATMVIAMSLAGCAGDRDGANTESGVLTGAGATFAMPIITLWADTYEDETDQRVNYNSIGSGGGIRAHIDKTVDFAASEAPLNEEQTQRAPGTLTVPFTIGTVTAAYNVDGVDDLRLTPDVIADIYLGEITRWDDDRLTEINPDADLPDQGIEVVHRSDGSGTTYIWTEYLTKVSDEWAEEVGFGTAVSWPIGIGANGNEGVGGAVLNNPGSIGYIEISYATQLDIPTASIQNQQDEWIEPSLEAATLAAASAADELPAGDEMWNNVSFTDPPGEGAYPISSFSYFFVYQDPCEATDGDISEDRAQAIVGWLQWTITEGQEYNNDVKNAAIPENVSELNLDTLEGMECHGEPLDVTR